MNITEASIAVLREKVKACLTDKRYAHTLAVEDMAARLGEIYLPDKVTELRAAALLHDITKRDNLEKQLQYCREFAIMVSENDVHSPKIFHAKTAAALAARDFAEWADPDVLSGIRWHTTGRDGMTVFEAIVYLADYIEDTRTFPDCVALRRFFWDRLETSGKEEALERTMELSFDMTIRNLLQEGAPIDSDTIAARNYYIFRRQEPAVETL